MTITDLIGVLRADGDGRALRLVHVFDTDRGDLWSALTEQDRLVRWFAPVQGDLVSGGEFLILFDADDPKQRTAGSVVDCQPQQRLVVTWRSEGEPESRVSIVLDEVESGTRMTLEHTALPSGSAAGYAAGWHTYLEQLAADLAGQSGLGSEWDARWAELLPSYQAQLHV